LLNELGRGGTAVVWHARDEVLHRPVAVKLLAARSARDPESWVRIRDEARAAANLLHPHIAQIYDFGEATDRDIPLPYVVMELVNGPTLQERAMAGPLPPRTIFRILGEVAAALAYAHAAGLVHRDVKMANIMVTGSGAKVVDFGIAAGIGWASEDMVLGTPTYLAPERLTGGAVVPASDVYALGVLLYKLLTGHPPWSVESTTQMLKAHVYVEPAPLPALPGVPSAVAAMIDRCLRKDPRSRPTASDVSSALADAAEASPDTERVRRDTALDQASAVPAASSGVFALATNEAPSLEAATWTFVPGRQAGAEPSTSASPRLVPHPRQAGGQSSGAQRNGVPGSEWHAAGAPVRSAGAVGPTRTNGARPYRAGGAGAPPVRRKNPRHLLAGGGLAGLIVAVLVAWLLNSVGDLGGDRSAAAPAGGGVSVAPTASGPSLPVATSEPAPSATVSSGPPAPTGPAKTAGPPAGGAAGQEIIRPTSPPTSANTISDPAPLDPPPIGTRLTVTGGVVYATCSSGLATLTGWEPAPGFSEAGVDPGPGVTTLIIFAADSDGAGFRATVTCRADSPTSVVEPL
jgi:hypothetical protein